MPDRVCHNDVRCWCDGELPPDAASRVEEAMQRDPALAAVAADDRALKQHVAKVMGTDRLSMEARSRIIAAMNEAQAPAPLPMRGSPAQPRSGAHEQHGRSSWFAGQQRANVFAIAAVLMLVVGAVLFGIYMRPIDDLIGTNTDLVADAAVWANDQHGACNSTAKRSKFIWFTLDEAQAGLSQWLQRPIPRIDLSSLGYEFLEAGKCGVPGAETSGHLHYARMKNGKPQARFSVFVAPDEGQFDGSLRRQMRPGEVYNCPSGRKCVHDVVRCTDTRTVYFLICCDDDDLGRVSQHIASTIANQGK